ncbi:MAG: DinB family protein [Desulfosarcinaceae bacterium]|nr:DinB family protein [Desulfosarcinaceae bacterium]
MGDRREELAARIEAFAGDVIDYTAALTAEEWRKTCEWEEWSAGVTARHIGNHLGIFELAAMIVRGEPLPQWTMDDINAMSNQDSQAHADCTQAEALELLQRNRDGMTRFLRGLEDTDLDRKGSMPAFGGEVTVAQLIDFVVFQSAAQHLESIKAAVAG